MKIWVIGKRGMLGCGLLEYLKKKNCSVIATSKEEADIMFALQDVILNKVDLRR